MLQITSYIIRFFSPLVLFVGLCGFGSYISYLVDYQEMDPQMKDAIQSIPYADGLWLLIISIIIFILGIWYGVEAHKNDIPVRWLWSKSKNDMFEFSLKTILGYALNIAAYPYAAFFIHMTFVSSQIQGLI